MQDRSPLMVSESSSSPALGPLSRTAAMVGTGRNGRIVLKNSLARLTRL